jgi:hypothetical protein|eukprot:scaffold1223_cov200-Alexandrium_tamarense.AAC.7
MCYAGDRKDATAYFKEIGYECPHDTNPAEYFIDLVTIDTEDQEKANDDIARIDFLHHRFLDSCSRNESSNLDIGAQQYTQEVFAVQSSAERVRIVLVLQSTVHRFRALLRRSWWQNARNLRVNALRLSASVVQAALFAAIFPSVRDDKSLTKSIADRVALLTYGVINMSMMSLMKTLDLFARERKVVTREQMRNSYSSLQYLMAKALAEIPLDTLFGFIFAKVLKSLTGLRTSFARLAKTYCLMTITSVSLGFAIGSLTTSPDTAMSLGVPIMIVYMIVGVINPSGVNPDEAPNALMKTLRRLSPIRWAIEAVVTAEFRGMEFGEKDRSPWGALKDLVRNCFALFVTLHIVSSSHN